MTAPPGPHPRVVLEVPDAVERDDLGVFVARAVRLDPGVAVRLRAGTGADGRALVAAWAPTPFDALVTRAVHGRVAPWDVTVVGSDLLAALTVVGDPSVEPGGAVDERWRGPVPAATPDGERWSVLDTVPADVLDGLAERGIARAREADPSGQPSAALLDQVVLTVEGHDRAGTPDAVRVPMRCVFALAGMGFLGGVGGGDGAAPVRVSTGEGWLRLDAHGGAVVRRRRAQLPWA